MAVVHLVIHGRVQGVGFRLFVQGEAEKRGLDGWVRNARDGSVEAVVSGADDVVEDMIKACWQGPPASEVTAVDRSDWPELVRAGFTVEPTA